MLPTLASAVPSPLPPKSASTHRTNSNDPTAPILTDGPHGRRISDRDVAIAVLDGPLRVRSVPLARARFSHAPAPTSPESRERPRSAVNTFLHASAPQPAGVAGPEGREERRGKPGRADWRVRGGGQPGRAAAAADGAAQHGRAARGQRGRRGRARGAERRRPARGTAAGQVGAQGASSQQQPR